MIQWEIPHIAPGRLSQITPVRWVEARRKRPPPGPTVRIQCENEEREEVNRKQEQIATDSFELEFENWWPARGRLISKTRTLKGILGPASGKAPERANNIRGPEYITTRKVRGTRQRRCTLQTISMENVKAVSPSGRKGRSSEKRQVCANV